MPARLYRKFQTRFFPAGFSVLFAPRKPRHPLARVLVGLAGLVLLAVLLVVGVVVGTAMLMGGLVVRTLGQRGEPARNRRPVVDAEYRVVKPGQPLLR